MNMSEIIKMDIYNNVDFAGDVNSFTEEEKVTVNLIKEIYESKNLRYLKTATHDGLRIPISLVIDDFSSYIKRALPGHEFDDFRLNLFRQPDKRDLYETFFDKDLFKGILMAGGAFTLPYLSKAGSGMISEKSDIQIEGSDLSFLIVIDSNVAKYTNIESIIHHEFYHAFNRHGYVEELVKEFRHMTTENEIFETFGNKMQFANVPTEEREADAFAEINVGERPNVGQLVFKYVPANVQMAAIVGAIYKLSMLPRLIASGRRWLF